MRADAAKKIDALRKRDGDACALCALPVHFPTGWKRRIRASAQLSEIEPSIARALRRGEPGYSHPENLRLAHRFCASRRYDIPRHTADERFHIRVVLTLRSVDDPDLQRRLDAALQLAS